MSAEVLALSCEKHPGRLHKDRSIVVLFMSAIGRVRTVHGPIAAIKCALTNTNTLALLLDTVLWIPRKKIRGLSVVMRLLRDGKRKTGLANTESEGYPDTRQKNHSPSQSERTSRTADMPSPSDNHCIRMPSAPIHLPLLHKEIYEQRTSTHGLSRVLPLPILLSFSPSWAASMLI